MRTENFSFVVKDIRITHLVSTRSKKISHSCLVPSRSRSLCGEIWVNYEGKRGDHFPLARQARSARGGWWERAQSARAKCLQLSRVSLVSALALLACSVTKPHESPWVGEGGGWQIPLTFSKLSPIDVRANSSSIWSIYDVNSLSSPPDCMFPWTPESKLIQPVFIQWRGSYASSE